MSKVHPILKASGLHFAYDNKAILKGLRIALYEGETLGILGESGSGKTSLLKVLGGLLEPSKGKVLFEGATVLGPSDKLIPGHENIKLVHQDFDLMPFLSSKENVLRNSLSASQTARNRIAGHYQKRLRIKDVSSQRAIDTSGGQKQRIAMAGVLSAKPDILLLDEPFSNLDYSLKLDLIRLLKTEWKPRAMVLVTHEPSDILNITDRIAVMYKGRIIQSGSPEEIYSFPKNEYVGRLLGPINTITTDEAGQFGLSVEKDLYLRPHQITINKDGVEAEVIYSQFMGSYYLTEVRVKSDDKIFTASTKTAYPKGTRVWLRVALP